MQVPLERDVRHILSDLGISLLDYMRVYTTCAGFRSHLLKLEDSQLPLPLTGSTFWDITPKYRFDALAIDIPRVANELAFAIGFSSIYLPQVAEGKRRYFPTCADAFFWYHIDFGIRLASSGWDRIALLLDLAFDLKTGTRCNFPLVLREIAKLDKQIVHEESFKELKAFRDGRFLDLEVRAGKGARHEATHLLSPGTRFLFEFHEAVPQKLEEVPSELRPEARRDMLVEHHRFYVLGVENTLRLVASRWP